MHWNPLIQILIKKSHEVFSGSRHLEIRVAPFIVPRNLCLRVGLKRSRLLSSRAHSVKKGSVCLQNDALIAILRVKGRESVFWKACVELCRVVGSAKTRIRKITCKKATEKSGFWFLTFPCVSGQTPEIRVPSFQIW